MKEALTSIGLYIIALLVFLGITVLIVEKPKSDTIKSQSSMIMYLHEIQSTDSVTTFTIDSLIMNK